MRQRSAASAAAALALCLGLVGGLAQAQPTPGRGPAPKYKLQPLNLRREHLGVDSFASAGRARMRNGDCAGALEAFDAALRTANDATLNRDRGLCHEQLGNPYPAIDDYRIYLAVAADAPDADGIRQRLARLEMQTSGHSSESTDTPDQTPISAAPAASGEGPRRDTIEAVDHDLNELASPLRAGKGFALAPFFALHKWNTSAQTNFGDARTWSESVGLALHWSIGASSAFFVEAGYEHFNDTSLAKLDGLTSMIGYEARFALDGRYNNQLFLAPGIGYEFISLSPTDPTASGESGGVVVPRLRFGWRHMITTSTAFDLSLDGGASGQALSHGSLFFTNGASSTVVLLAANVAVQWGL
jgi:hypothetical protein